MTKQVLLDILIVLVAPIILVVGYLYVGADKMSSLFLVAPLDVAALPGGNGEEMGAKSTAALNELRSIHFDEALFSDPTFQSLIDFTGSISTTTAGRRYPFSTPDEVKILLKRSVQSEPASSQKNGGAVVSSTVKIDTVKKIAN